MSRKIEIRIPPTGDIRIETSGYVGAACQAATESLIRALGGEVTCATPKPELFQSEISNEGENLVTGKLTDGA